MERPLQQLLLTRCNPGVFPPQETCLFPRMPGYFPCAPAIDKLLQIVQTAWGFHA